MGTLPGLHLLHARLPLAPSHSIREGGVLETHSPLTEFILKTHCLVRNEITHFLGAKKFSFVPQSGEERPGTAHVSRQEPRWNSQRLSLCAAMKQGKVAYPLLQHSQCNCLNTHMLHCQGLCPPWSRVTMISHLLA